MLRYVIVMLACGVLGAANSSAEIFVDNKDMNNGRITNLVATTNVTVGSEMGGATKYWYATSGSGSVTYGYTFSLPIQSASFYGNLLVNFTGDKVWLDVSRDGITFTNIYHADTVGSLHPTNHGDPALAGPPPSFNLTSYLAGSNSAFIRARMSGGIGSQFMRTADNIPGFNVPNVYQFSAVTVPEPSTYALALAGLACGGWHLRRRRRA